MSITRVLDKGLMVIPREIRDKLHLKKGDRLEIKVSDDNIVIKPRRGDLTTKYEGIFKGGKLTMEELEELYGYS